MSAAIAVSVFELRLPVCRSLKEKRKVIKSLIERARHRYGIAIAESDFHDVHQRAEITLALVSGSERDAERVLDRLREMIESRTELQLVFWEPQLLGSTE